MQINFSLLFYQYNKKIQHKGPLKNVVAHILRAGQLFLTEGHKKAAAAVKLGGNQATNDHQLFCRYGGSEPIKKTQLEEAVFNKLFGFQATLIRQNTARVLIPDFTEDLRLPR